mmetsp:Transcript_85699/g.179062  ORF Transcript_85699/g.179062 Transcript_85699/m.179062 type:complete len:102 (+) Transcript_85699:468-773(+)
MVWIGLGRSTDGKESSTSPNWPKAEATATSEAMIQSQLRSLELTELMLFFVGFSRLADLCAKVSCLWNGNACCVLVHFSLHLSIFCLCILALPLHAIAGDE